MRPFIFAQMLLLQLADEHLKHERFNTEPDSLRLAVLFWRKKRIAARLRKSVAPLTLAWG